MGHHLVQRVAAALGDAQRLLHRRAVVRVDAPDRDLLRRDPVRHERARSLARAAPQHQCPGHPHQVQRQWWGVRRVRHVDHHVGHRPVRQLGYHRPWIVQVRRYGASRPQPPGHGQARLVARKADHDDLPRARLPGRDRSRKTLRAGSHHDRRVAYRHPADGAQPADPVAQHRADQHGNVARKLLGDAVYTRGGRQVDVLAVAAPQVGRQVGLHRAPVALGHVAHPVPAHAAPLASAASERRLDHDAVSGPHTPGLRRRWADVRDAPHDLVPQDHRRVGAVVVEDIAPADAPHLDLEDAVVLARLRHGELLHLDPARPHENGGCLSQRHIGKEPP